MKIKEMITNIKQKVFNKEEKEDAHFDNQNTYNVYDEKRNVIYKLNAALAEQQKLTPIEIEALTVSHSLRYYIFTLSFVYKNNTKIQRMLANIFRELEFEQQDLWHFKRDAKYHRFYEFPGCECPKIDNSDRIGYSDKVFSSTCPIHGQDINI